MGAQVSLQSDVGASRAEKAEESALVFAKLRDVALGQDAAGCLDVAQRTAGQLVLWSSRNGDLREIVAALLLLARISRHHRDAASLRRARDAAGVASGLAEMPLLRADRIGMVAALETAACLIESGSVDEGVALASRWASDPDAALAGWAWTSIGRARLAEGRTGQAVAALSNAVAEFERVPAGQRARRVRGSGVLLGMALTRNGDLERGSAILEGDFAYWAASDAPRRLRIEHHLAAAENRRLRGDVAGARTLLSDAKNLLVSCTGMEAAAVRAHQQLAACELDWRQVRLARSSLAQAEAARARLLEESSRPSVAEPVPRPEPVRLLGRRVSPAAVLHAELAVASEGLNASIGSGRRALAAQPAALATLAGSRAAAIDRMVAQAERCVVLSDGVLRELIAHVELLGGLPGEERREAALLVRLGGLFRELQQPRLLEAERLLRRALVRLDRMPSMGLWLAEANVRLAMTLQDGGRVREALPYALRGVSVLDAERFRMDGRAVRRRWREAQGPAFDCAIDLAHRCGRTEVAADLIVFSRAAGIVTDSMTRLLPLPTLHYVDGTVSSLGTDDACRFV